LIRCSIDGTLRNDPGSLDPGSLRTIGVTIAATTATDHTVAKTPFWSSHAIAVETGPG
jgi:hypothetical protein